MSEVFFVTGAQGCIGAWVVKLLLERGASPVVYDLSEDTRRLRLLLPAASLSGVRFVRGDVTDGDAVRRALAGCGARRVIHLAGLQVPTCRAQPALGAMVNVVGTLNLLEAARACGVERFAYASSAAVYGASEDDVPVDEAVEPQPATHYGVFKRANEGNARVAWLEHGLSSVGLRPLTVYGPGRDQGLTSDPTKAMVAALRGEEFTIRFGGATDFLYARDAAEAFVACAESAPPGAHVFNIHGESTTLQRFVELLDERLDPEERGRVRVEGEAIPIAAAMDGGALQQAIPSFRPTPLAAGIDASLELFRGLRAAGRLGEVELPS